MKKMLGVVLVCLFLFSTIALVIASEDNPLDAIREEIEFVALFDWSIPLADAEGYFLDAGYTKLEGSGTTTQYQKQVGGIDFAAGIAHENGKLLGITAQVPVLDVSSADVVNILTDIYGEPTKMTADVDTVWRTEDAFLLYTAGEGGKIYNTMLWASLEFDPMIAVLAGNVRVSEPNYSAATLAKLAQTASAQDAITAPADSPEPLVSVDVESTAPPDDANLPISTETESSAAETPAPAADTVKNFESASNDELVTWKNEIESILIARGYYPLSPLQKGDEGETVVRLQDKLTELFYFDKAVDGKYGQSTITAVKAFQKDNKMEQDGIATIEVQEALFSDKVAPKTTPTPKPTKTPPTTPTPAPTAVPDSFVLEVTKAIPFTKYGYVKFRIDAKNASTEYTIDAFDLAVRCYDAYGMLLSEFNHGDTTTYYTESDCKIKPNGKYTMGNYYWDLTGFENTTRIEVAVQKYHTTDGKTIFIPLSDYVWVEGTLK